MLESLNYIMLPVLAVFVIFMIVAFTAEIYMQHSEYKKRETVAKEFIDINEDWWTTKTNNMYGWRYYAEKYMDCWIQTGRFGPDYSLPNFIMLENKFSEFIDGKKGFEQNHRKILRRKN